MLGKLRISCAALPPSCDFGCEMKLDQMDDSEEKELLILGHGPGCWKE